jgi:GWxTD domain-containing protein
MRAFLWILALGVLSSSFVPETCRARSFSLYAHAYLDSTRSPAVSVTAEIPFKSLVFFKKKGWYDSQYEVYLAIRREDDGDEDALTSVLHGRAVARGYDETSLIDHRSKATRTFRLAPGKYRIGASLRVLKTDIVLKRSLELEVPDFLAKGIGFSSPVVLMVPTDGPTSFSRWKDFASRESTGVSAPSDLSLALFERRPAVRFEIYTDGSAQSPVECNVLYEVRGPGGRQILYGKRRVELTGRSDVFVLCLNVDDWEPGAYTINLRARANNPVREASTSVVLNVDVTRAMLGRNFDETLSILSLIATDEELEGLKTSTEENRAEEWSKFWAARDPDPTTVANEALEEYLRRVRYVMKHFSTLEPGWKSDRGRVYIRYGPPIRIERTSDSRFQGEYEIWRYPSLGRVFVFYDMFGLGDYRLVQGDVY